MTQVRLQMEDFVNGRYTVQYGDNQEAVFIMVDEEFPGMNDIARVNKIVILTRRIIDGEPTKAEINSSVVNLHELWVGRGNRLAGVRSDNPSLRGKLLNKDNMHECTVLLYEDGDS